MGIQSYDYDILNDFGQTDFQIDLFAEINKAYENEPSVFDSIGKDDLIFAFFPCIRFENQIMLWFRGQNHAQDNWSIRQKMIYDMKLLTELKDMYFLVNKLFMICQDRNLNLIMENPYSEEHFLRRYWCIPATMIDRDRRQNGDYYAKPTQYWFVNIEKKENVLFEIITDNSVNCKDAIESMNSTHYGHTGAKNQRVARSMIHPDYANRFVRQYLL